MTESKLADLAAQFLTAIKTELSQTTPMQRRAWSRVMSVVQATVAKGIEKRITEGTRACLATTAKADALAVIGRDYGLERTAAVKYVAACSVHATTGISIPINTELTSDATGAYYKTTATATESGGHIVFSVQATDAGEDANLEAGETLTLTSPISGVTPPVTITAVTTYGADEEDLEDFRARVLAAQRTAGGGGNTADYREWAEAVSGVAHAYPYSGRPVIWEVTSDTISFASGDHSINTSALDFTDSDLGTLVAGDMIEVEGSAANDGFFTVLTVAATKIVVVETITTGSAGVDVILKNGSLPGDRTVFVESTGATRIPTTDLLGNVRDAITEDADGIARPGLGDVDSTLFVEPVYVTTIDITIYGLSIDSTQETAAKAAVLADLTSYLLSCHPFIEGLDFEMDRRDNVTFLGVSDVVQGVLDVYGATADLVELVVDSEVVTSYQLSQGELVKIGNLTWESTT
jgi:hypothetical protein